jgi:hypothetical protein
MLETKWDIDNQQGRGWKYDGDQLTLFSDLETNRLEELLIEYLKKFRTNGEIYEFTLRKGFLPTHSTQILKKLQTDYRLDLTKKDNSKIRKGAFYINYNNYKEYFSKISIKLK